ncbi:hypothetical protein BS47DRAFT_1324215 [Hydnum rufescens UP504]|uniref:DAGKc domain-containing protein n=1 Tax=Hydnum rufescens UP504 TaxID=1448309 RepID=A0A9P6E294_9AGAM|nr:hypothetical protein BS47DRAFT_1324215 [Hydnum rufescens UP504]
MIRQSTNSSRRTYFLIIVSRGWPYLLHYTLSEEEAGALAKEFIRRSKEARPSIVVAGGDGTLHNLINWVAVDAIEKDGPIPGAAFFLVPTGTANALYSSLYPRTDQIFTHPLIISNPDQRAAYGLQSITAGDTKPRVLNVAAARIYEANSTHPSSTTLSVVVNSTSLHAEILDTAEKYRDSIPGIERFKVAAAENILNWTSARVELFPLPHSGVVKQYDPAQRTFIPVTGVSGSDAVRLEGPFFYFLSTVNVDRLESALITTPLTKTLVDDDDKEFLDVIILRPARNPTFQGNNEEERKSFIGTATKWFNAMYSGGTHIHLSYNEEVKQDPTYVTEYFRVGGWQWIPDGDDHASSLLCVDGTILKIPNGGKATVSVTVSKDEDEGFRVFA